MAALPKEAIVVNTGRGQVLDLVALTAALDSGHIFAAGLDVVFPEPLPPTIPKISPRLTDKFKPSCMHVPPNTVFKSFISIIGSWSVIASTH